MSYGSTASEHRKRAGKRAKEAKADLSGLRRALADGASCSVLVHRLVAASYRLGELHTEGYHTRSKYGRRATSKASYALFSLGRKIAQRCDR